MSLLFNRASTALDTEGRAEKQLLYVSKSLAKVGRQTKSGMSKWMMQSFYTRAEVINSASLQTQGRLLRAAVDSAMLPQVPPSPARTWWIGTPWRAADMASTCMPPRPPPASASESLG